MRSSGPRSLGLAPERKKEKTGKKTRAAQKTKNFARTRRNRFRSDNLPTTLTSNVPHRSCSGTVRVAVLDLSPDP
jgi:hypothetical protein